MNLYIYVYMYTEWPILTFAIDISPRLPSKNVSYKKYRRFSLEIQLLCKTFFDRNVPFPRNLDANKNGSPCIRI